MKNITIAVEDNTAYWVRVWAARRNMSVSRLLGEVVEEYMRQEKGYEVAKNRFLSKTPHRLRENEKTYPDRDSLHECDSLR